MFNFNQPAIALERSRGLSPSPPTNAALSEGRDSRSVEPEKKRDPRAHHIIPSHPYVLRIGIPRARRGFFLPTVTWLAESTHGHC